MEKLKKFLKAIGMEQHYDALIAEAQDFDPAKLANEAKGVMKNSLLNDPEFIGGIERDQRSAVLSSKERKIMKLTGITKDELEALPKETRFDSLLDLAVERLKASAPAEGADKKLTEELERLRLKAQKQAEQIEKNELALTAKDEEVAGAKKSIQVERNVERLLAKHKLILDPADASELTMRALLQEFDMEPSGSGLTLYKKGTKLKATDAETEKDLTAEQFIEKHVAEKKWVAVNNGKPEGERQKTREHEERNTRSEKGPKKELPGMVAARKAAEERSKRVPAEKE